MKALTLIQPWAGLLVLGIKKFETRSWNTKHRGPLAIHSSAKMSKEGKALLQGLMDSDPTRFFEGSEAYEVCTELGSVLGSVNISNTLSTNNDLPDSYLELLLGNYEANRWYWECSDPVIFPAPIPATGKLSLWEWSNARE